MPYKKKEKRLRRRIDKVQKGGVDKGEKQQLKNLRRDLNQVQGQRQTYSRARRDIRMANDPLIEEIARAREQEIRDYEQEQEHMAAIYQALNNQIAPLGGEYDAAMQGIIGDYGASMGQMGEILGPGYDMAGVPAEDGAAAAAVNAQLAAQEAPGVGMVGAIGEGGHMLLANDRARNAAYQTSLQRQSGLDRMATERSVLQDHMQVLDDLRQQKLDVTKDIPTQIMQRLDQLKQERFQNRLARDEFGLRESIANKQENRADQEANTNRRIQNTVLNQMTDEEKRVRFGNKIKGINKQLPRINQRIGYLEDNKPYDPSTDPVHGGLEPNPKLIKLKRRRRNLRQQRKKYRRRRSNL